MLVDLARTPVHGNRKVRQTACAAHRQRGVLHRPVFRFGLALAGIRHQRSDPGYPWQNGRIERLFRTLKRKLDQWEVTGFGALNDSLAEFRFFYNHVRPHQYLQGRTPAEAWSRIDPYTRPVRREYWFVAWNGLLQGYYLRR